MCLRCVFEGAREGAREGRCEGARERGSEGAREGGGGRGEWRPRWVGGKAPPAWVSLYIDFRLQYNIYIYNIYNIYDIINIYIIYIRHPLGYRSMLTFGCNIIYIYTIYILYIYTLYIRHPLGYRCTSTVGCLSAALGPGS